MIAARSLEFGPLDEAEVRRLLADPERPLVLVPRIQPLPPATVKRLLGGGAFVHPMEGTPAEIGAGLARFGDDVAAEAASLAHFFAALTGNCRLRARLECVATDHCKRLHADYVDLRLITTLAGAGTEYSPDGSPGHLQRVPAGWIGLFKGERFAPGHRPCLHRSPPIAPGAPARLLLVLDTPPIPEME